MTLAQTQRDFSNWLHGGLTEGRMLFGESAQAGLGVYRNNFRAQLAGCLEESFERTRQWIGGEAFHEAVVRHVERVSPSSWTLDAYPRDFPATLALLYPDDPEVAQLAKLELALANAFVGSDAEPITAELIATVDWDRAILVFAPTLDLLPLTTNAPSIWTALANDIQPPPAELLTEKSGLLVWRHNEMSRFRAIDMAEHRAILRLRTGMSFAALCAQVVDEIGQQEGITITGTWLGQWLADGLLTDIVDGDTT